MPTLSFNPMIIISWNVRGAGGMDIRRAFKDMVNAHNLDLLVLTETKLSGDRQIV